MNYAAIRDALKQWVRDSTGLPCRWEDEPTGLQMKLPAAFVLTGPINVEQVGEDFVRWDPIDAGDEQVRAAVVGHREFDVMLRCVARSSDPSKSAQYQLERLRLALARPSTRVAFDAADFAVIDMSKSVQFNAPFEERHESIASATLRCTAVVDEALDSTPGSDTRDAPESTLTSVELTTKIKGVDGSDLPSPPNVSEKLITAE